MLWHKKSNDEFNVNIVFVSTETRTTSSRTNGLIILTLNFEKNSNQIAHSAICLRRVHFALTFASSSPQSVHRQRKKIDLANVFINISRFFFLRFVSLWNFHPLNHVSCFLFSHQFSRQHLRFGFNEMRIGTFLISIHFQQLIRAEKENRRKKLTRKSRFFFRRSTWFGFKCSSFTIQSAKKEEREKKIRSKKWWKNNLSFKFLHFGFDNTLK